MNSVSSNSVLAEIIFLICAIIIAIVSLYPFKQAKGFGKPLESLEILYIVGGISACLSLVGVTWLFQKAELSTSLSTLILIVNVTIVTWLHRHLFMHESVRKYSYGHVHAHITPNN